jgi:hypothetical protein
MKLKEEVGRKNRKSSKDKGGNHRGRRGKSNKGDKEGVPRARLLFWIADQVS